MTQSMLPNCRWRMEEMTDFAGDVRQASMPEAM